MVELNMVTAGIQHQNGSEQSLHFSTAGLSTHSASALNLKSRQGTSDRVRYVGKHSKDKVLAIYLQKRTIFEHERDFKVESLLGVVRISQFHADRLQNNDQVVVVGVLARLSSDFGLQFGEYTVFQHETRIFPRDHAQGAVNTQGYFDLDNMYVNGMPDDHHLQFSLKLPSGMPSSVHLASPMNNHETWGLSYYVYAYVTTASAVKEMLGNQPPGHLFWTKLKFGRKSSKVFLSFAKQFIDDRERLTANPSSGEVVKTSFLSSSTDPAMRATASLDKPAYQYGDVINVTVKIFNPKKSRINGIKINVKQLVTIKVGADPKSSIKTCIGRYSFSNNKEELFALDTGYHQTLTSLKNAEAFSDTLKIRPHIDPLRYLYQLALEAKLPKSEQGSPILAANSSFDGTTWPLDGGLDRLRIFKVEYYVNVHVDLPWSKDLIIKLPFKFVNLDAWSRPVSSDALNAPIFSNLGRTIVYETNGGEDGKKSGIMDELKDLRPVPNNLINFVDNASSSGNSPTFEDRVIVDSKPKTCFLRQAQVPKGIGSAANLKDDAVQAKASLIQLRSKLSEEQHLVLQNPLDSGSMLLRFDPRRLVLVKEFLAVLEEVVMIWLPQMSQKVSALSLVKCFADLSLFDPTVADKQSRPVNEAAFLSSDDDNVGARCLVQNIVGRLGMFHSQLVQYQSPRSIQESKLEDLNGIVDDVELMLTKIVNGLDGKLDDSGRRLTPELLRELIGHIQKKAIHLVSVIPFYDKFDQDLLRVKSKITSFGLIDTLQPAALVFDWGENFDSIMENLAQCFEEMSSLLTSSELTGSKLTSLFAEYVDALINLIQTVPSLSDRAGVAIFWHWQYLHAIIDAYYCGPSEHHRLILPDRLTVNWNHRIKNLIPPQWDLVTAGSDTNRLNIVGTRVIAAMQQLVDTKFDA